MKITTNNQPRDLLTLWEFSEKEQAQIRSDYDWLDDIESDCCFFRYKISEQRAGIASHGHAVAVIAETRVDLRQFGQRPNKWG